MKKQLERQHKLGREAFDLGGHVERRDGTDRACSRPDESLRLMQQVRCISHRGVLPIALVGIACDILQPNGRTADPLSAGSTIHDMPNQAAGSICR